MPAFENMKVNLLANRLVPEKVPLVLQYNKQDLPDLQSGRGAEEGAEPLGPAVVPGRGVARRRACWRPSWPWCRTCSPPSR